MNQIINQDRKKKEEKTKKRKEKNLIRLFTDIVAMEIEDGNGSVVEDRQWSCFRGTAFRISTTIAPGRQNKKNECHHFACDLEHTVLPYRVRKIKTEIYY